MVAYSPWNMSYNSYMSRYAHACACRGLDSAKGLVHMLLYGTRVLTKQGVPETVVVGRWRCEESGGDLPGWRNHRGGGGWPEKGKNDVPTLRVVSGQITLAKPCRGLGELSGEARRLGVALVQRNGGWSYVGASVGRWRERRRTPCARSEDLGKRKEGEG
uniref:Uncharacterized protein n=1 Tax=Leersia perrieri TaxID=77586 RepID=A0A0D9XBW5_9ORYZ